MIVCDVNDLFLIDENLQARRKWSGYDTEEISALRAILTAGPDVRESKIVSVNLFCNKKERFCKMFSRNSRL